MSDQRCLNCGALLEGPYCYACGQPVKGMIRQLRSVLGDLLDTVFEYDSRIWRTLLPLYFAPGRITLDFIAGRRVRFVTPFRLAFLLLVLAFLVLQLDVTTRPVPADADRESGIFDATTTSEVATAREHALAELAEARSRVGDDPEQAQRLEQTERTVRDEAARRSAWIEAAERARAEGREPPPEAKPRARFYFNDEPWDPRSNPLEVEWLPAAANGTLNDWLKRALDNAEQAQRDPAHFTETFLGMLPVALFALLPLFALLLKLFYAFTGRLYMEHMVVALHSHAFFGIATMVAALLDRLSDTLAGSSVALPVGLLLWLSLAWIPVYTLIMQRRVYGQRWALTVVKFAAIGTIYLVLLTVALTAAGVVTLIRG